MQKGIHPLYYDVVVNCACGAQFQTKSTLPAITVEICSACHPLFTGKQKLIDTAGRIEKFERKYGKRQAKQTAPIKQTEQTE